MHILIPVLGNESSALHLRQVHLLAVKWSEGVFLWGKVKDMQLLVCANSDTLGKLWYILLFRYDNIKKQQTLYYCNLHYWKNHGI